MTSNPKDDIMTDFPELGAMKKALQALFVSAEANRFPQQAQLARYHHARMATCVDLLESAQRQADSMLLAQMATLIIEQMGKETLIFIGTASAWSDRTTDKFKECSEAVRAEVEGLAKSVREYISTLGEVAYSPDVEVTRLLQKSLDQEGRLVKADLVMSFVFNRFLKCVPKWLIKTAMSRQTGMYRGVFNYAKELGYVKGQP